MVFDFAVPVPWEKQRKTKISLSGALEDALRKSRHLQLSECITSTSFMGRRKNGSIWHEYHGFLKRLAKPTGQMLCFDC